MKYIYKKNKSNKNKRNKILIFIIVVLLGTKENLDLTGGVDKIFLDNIVKKMKELKGELIGIISRVTSLYL